MATNRTLARKQAVESKYSMAIPTQQTNYLEPHETNIKLPDPRKKLDHAHTFMLDGWMHMLGTG